MQHYLASGSRNFNNSPYENRFYFLVSCMRADLVLHCRQLLCSFCFQSIRFDILPQYYHFYFKAMFLEPHQKTGRMLVQIAKMKTLIWWRSTVQLNKIILSIWSRRKVIQVLATGSDIMIKLLKVPLNGSQEGPVSQTGTLVSPLTVVV